MTAEPERWTEPVAHRDARDLGVARHPAPAAAERTDRVGHRREPGLGPRHHPGPGQELDPDRGGHRAEQREQKQVAGEPVRGVAAFVGDQQRDGDADDEAEDPREHAGGDRPPDSEDPPDEDAREDREDEGRDQEPEVAAEPVEDRLRQRCHRRQVGTGDCAASRELLDVELTVGVAGAQHLLVELADARLRHLVDERPALGQLPPRDPCSEEVAQLVGRSPMRPPSAPRRRAVAPPTAGRAPR